MYLNCLWSGIGRRQRPRIPIGLAWFDEGWKSSGRAIHSPMIRGRFVVLSNLTGRQLYRIRTVAELGIRDAAEPSDTTGQCDGHCASGWSGSRERGEIAVAAARRLAPQAGETYLAEALFFYWGNRDYEHALHSLQEAARLLPNNVEVPR